MELTSMFLVIHASEVDVGVMSYRTQHSVLSSEQLDDGCLETCLDTEDRPNFMCH